MKEFKGALEVGTDDEGWETVYVKGAVSETEEPPVPEPDPEPTPPDGPPYQPVTELKAEGNWSLDLTAPNHALHLTGDVYLEKPHRAPYGQAGHVEFFNPDGHIVQFDPYWRSLDSQPLRVGPGTALLVYYSAIDCCHFTIYQTAHVGADENEEKEGWDDR